MIELLNVDYIPDQRTDNRAYQRYVYNKKKSDPEFKQKKAMSAKKSNAKNREKVKERNKRQRAQNPEYYREYRNKYRTKNPNGIYDVIKQSAKRRSVSLDITRPEFKKWYEDQNRVCFYCKRNESDVIADKDIVQSVSKRLTIDRVDNSVGYTVNNLVLCCRRCNTIKGNYFSKDEMLLIGQIINKKNAL